MKRIEALKKAEEISKIVKNNAHLLRECNYDDDGWHFNSGKKMKIFEVILFGSTTRKCDNEIVDDIDLLIIDNGVYSAECALSENDDSVDFYHCLSDNFSNFAERITENHADAVADYSYEDFLNLIYWTDVDMHVLPLKFFRNKKFREEVKARHHDLDFFKNVFATAMRWRMEKQFVPVDVSYFERKYKVRLQDLKK